MEALLLIFGLFGCLLCGLIGSWIGSQVGKKTTGFWLGFLLGFIGWIIVLLLPRESSSPVQSNGHHEFDEFRGTMTFEQYKRKAKYERPHFAHWTKADQLAEYERYIANEKTQSGNPMTEKPLGNYESGRGISSSSTKPLSFEEYKKQAKARRPGFSHKSGSEQRAEYNEYVLRETGFTNKLPAASPTVTSPTHSDSIESRLERLKSLKDKGLITEDEASRRRLEILSDL